MTTHCCPVVSCGFGSSSSHRFSMLLALVVVFDVSFRLHCRLESQVSADEFHSLTYFVWTASCCRYTTSGDTRVTRVPPACMHVDTGWSVIYSSSILSVQANICKYITPLFLFFAANSNVNVCTSTAYAYSCGAICR